MYEPSTAEGVGNALRAKLVNVVVEGTEKVAAPSKYYVRVYRFKK